MGHKIKDGFNYLVAYENYLLKGEINDKVMLCQGGKTIANNSDNQKRKRVYDGIKLDYPTFAEYVNLLKQREHHTGYFRGKVDKKILKAACNLIANTDVMNKINQLSSDISLQINSHTKKNLVLER